MAIDILKSGFRMPSTAYVLATGPNGLNHYGDIPPNAFIIAVNQAIDIHTVHKSIWLCGDGTLVDKGWFRNAAKELTISNYPLDNHLNPTPIFDEGVLLSAYPGVSYFYKHGHSLAKQPWGCEPGVLRGRATIIAQAVQLAYWMGARKIILCGIDMSGNKYYHGGDVNNRQLDWGKDIWLSQVWFNILINWLEKKKIEVLSLSRTSLDVKRIGADNAIT